MSEEAEGRDVSSGGRFVGAAPMSVAAFLVKPEESGGPPVRLTSWKEFEQLARLAGGGEDGGSESGTACVTVSKTLWAAVYGWFQNGGGRCYLVPVRGEGGLAGALAGLEEIEEVSMVVAPELCSEASQEEAREAAVLIADHCERMSNRMAVLHAPGDAVPDNAADFLADIDSRGLYVAVYYPWVEVLDPEDPKRRLTVPPAGHVAGVWARVDAERGVHKAPANETLRGVIGLAYDVSDVEQIELNNWGVNAVRSFPGSGILVWGARTLAASDASDVEHAYVNVRRSVNFIRQSVRQSTRWVVFEPNDDRLRTSVTAMVTDFLRGLWRKGVLVGKSPEEAFYVTCDETNNPPEEAAQNKLRCEIGVALVRPAEFITFHVSQQNASNA